MPSAPPPATCALSLHDALPIYFLFMSMANLSYLSPWKFNISTHDGGEREMDRGVESLSTVWCCSGGDSFLCPWKFLFIEHGNFYRSEEHTSELQSHVNLVCRLLPPPRPALFPYTTLFRSISFLCPWQIYHIFRHGNLTSQRMTVGKGRWIGGWRVCRRCGAALAATLFCAHGNFYS